MKKRDCVVKFQFWITMEILNNFLNDLNSKKTFIPNHRLICIIFFYNLLVIKFLFLD